MRYLYNPLICSIKIKYWSSGVVVNMPPCHGGDRGFESHLDRHLEIEVIFG